MSKQKAINRRKFIKSSVTGMIGTGMISASMTPNLENPIQESKPQKIKEYRTLGRTGFKASDIGMGASFLTNPSVLEMALDRGINYLDTAEHYSGGRSESTIGQVVKNRDRKPIFITTKLNLSFGGKDTEENIKNRFLKCLQRLRTDYVDCLMIHMCTFDQVQHAGFHQVATELKAEGKVRYIGLSNHGLEQRIYGHLKDPMEKVVFAAVEDGRFDLVLVVYNFLQKDQGEKILKACKSNNIGVTLMKTNPVNVYHRKKASIDRALQNGRNISESLQKLMDEYRNWITQTESFKKKYGLKSEDQVRDAAIKFVLSHPDIHSVCPTIHNFDELETFLALSGKKLESTDTSMLLDYESGLSRYYCRHACGICESACPQGVPVNTIMRYNHYFEVQGMEKYAMLKYDRLTRTKAKQCSDCSGLCESACPHGVPIQALLMHAHENLALC
jgi:predicted aldo/keto reductase-like oxidoreductase